MFMLTLQIDFRTEGSESNLSHTETPTSWNRRALEDERPQMEALSEHLQWDIISRLDWTSLPRAAAVCRLWRSMVSTRNVSCLHVSCRRLMSRS